MHCVSAMRVGNSTNQLATLMLFLISASMSGCVAQVRANASNSAPAPIIVSTSPPSAALQTSQTQQFTAAVQNDSQNKGVTWEQVPNALTWKVLGRGKVRTDTLG